MCRIAFFPGNTVHHKWTQWFMGWLESRLGGHGNGVGFWDDETPVVVKGVSATPGELVEVAEGPTLFHTRLATVGTVSDKNCHPFVVGDGIYCHNGSFFGYRAIRRWMEKREVTLPDDVTDSLVLATYAELFVSDFKKLLRSRFGVLARLGSDGRLLVVITNYSFAMGRLFDTGEIVYASEFPDDYEYVRDVKVFRPGTVAILSDKGPEFIKGGFLGETSFQTTLA